MFLIDDLLLAPWRGLIFVLGEINQAVQAELEADERRLMGELAGLHRRLDEGLITEAEFEVGEEQLLDRLDRLHHSEDRDARDDQSG